MTSGLEGPKLYELGWSVTEGRDSPPDPEPVFPVSEGLDHLLIDVEDRDEFRNDLVSLVYPVSSHRR